MTHSILVVEDSPTQALTLKWMLERAGYAVETAEDGKIGLEKALAKPPEMVVTDIIMPVMDGYEMTSHLKADPLTADTPVIILTTKDQPLDIIRGLEAGADHFIVKSENYSVVQRVQSIFKWIEDSRAGCLPEKQHLNRFGNDIIITQNREQILQSLLQATASIVECQAMAILVHGPAGERTLFVLSFKPLETSTVEQLDLKMTTLLAQVRIEPPALVPAQKVLVITEPQGSMTAGTGDLLRSFLEVPLIINEEVTGLMGVFSSRDEAFDIKHVRFLFDMGQKAATILSRIKAERHGEGV